MYLQVTTVADIETENEQPLRKEIMECQNNTKTTYQMAMANPTQTNNRTATKRIENFNQKVVLCP